jgi:2-polyprenyl-6-methoxyphenol hydroxylase-like FAD-dependent oxidoreductase
MNIMYIKFLVHLWKFSILISTIFITPSHLVKEILTHQIGQHSLFLLESSNFPAAILIMSLPTDLPLASTPSISSLAIIGAGLGGLTLALALKKYNITSQLFEMRDPSYDVGGAIMLSPNALRVLDNLGVYERIRNKGYNFETLTFKEDNEESGYKTTGKYLFGHEEMYGFKALRIYRSVLIAELRKMVEELDIEIQYGMKYDQIIREDSTSVTFAFQNGTEKTADILIGADGIHSKIRSYFSPNIIAQYSGFLGVTYAISSSKIRLPTIDFPLPVTLHGKNGAFVFAPQNVDGGELFVGRQFRYPMQDRSAWDALLKDKEELIAMHQADMEQWSDLVQSGQEQASAPETHSFNIWPFHTVPKLESWASETGRVIILGDAAHAIPPTAGQGANQAFEDSYSLACLLKTVGSEVDLKEGLKIWQDYRQERVDKVLDLTNQMNNIRLPEAERKLLPKDNVWKNQSAEVGEGGQLAWLYLIDIEKDMEDLFKR